ncbi:MAG: acetolactate decarboxylase [Ignavibacteriales bacterium]|nr:acetolactate decarboxylase [Ignavibacteriales bacterium]
MKKYLLISILSIYAITYSQDKLDIIYQTSTINALMEGVFDGPVSFAELKKHGDFGLGTFNSVDGEMIELDGIIYQVKADGKIYPVDGKMQTPFSVVTFFKADNSFAVKEIDLKKIEEEIDKSIPSKNLFYAFKVTGNFAYVKTRSVPGQSKPYPKLIEVTKNQAVFEFKNLKGTLIGFRVPTYANGFNVPGYHFHFLSEDKKCGGHLLDCNLVEGNISIDQKQNILVSLPSTKEFFDADLSQDKQLEVKKAEK